MEQKNKHSPFATILFVALSCIFAGGLIGGVTNLINGAASPYYFRRVMGWDFPDIWVASIAQGIFEGFLYGVLFGFFFSSAFAYFTKGKAPYSFAIKQLAKVMLLIVSFWFIGGIMAIVLALLSPDFYADKFIYAVPPSEKIELIKFAWVGGSIWGELIGGLFSSILGIFIIKISWNKELSGSK